LHRPAVRGRLARGFDASPLRRHLIRQFQAMRRLTDDLGYSPTGYRSKAGKPKGKAA
jgi:hypothetical protein